MPLPSLADWDSFWVITGSSAGALTGLMFVVITLGAESRGVRSEAGVRAFGSPVLVHFCQVLFLSAFMSIPRHTAASLALVLTGMGTDGTRGATDIVASGGSVIAQDESTSVVWGMPRSVAQAGLCSAVLPLDQIAPKVLRVFAGDRT